MVLLNWAMCLVGNSVVNTYNMPMNSCALQDKPTLDKVKSSKAQQQLTQLAVQQQQLVQQIQQIQIQQRQFLYAIITTIPLFIIFIILLKIINLPFFFKT
jgi:hypothetical protein